jgi:3-oxoacyl-[acyl-carrier protein] reductase
MRCERTNRNGGPTPHSGLPCYHALRTKSADDVLDSIHALGGRAEAYEADLTNPAVIPQIFDWVETVFGPVDVLVNNASHYDDSDTVFTTSVEHSIGPLMSIWAQRYCSSPNSYTAINVAMASRAGSSI